MNRFDDFDFKFKRTPYSRVCSSDSVRRVGTVVSHFKTAAFNHSAISPSTR